MRQPRLPVRAMTSIAAVFAALLVNGCEAQVWGAPPAVESTPQAPVLAPQAPPPGAPPAPPTATFDGLDAHGHG